VEDLFQFHVLLTRNVHPWVQLDIAAGTGMATTCRCWVGISGIRVSEQADEVCLQGRLGRDIVGRIVLREALGHGVAP